MPPLSSASAPPHGPPDTPTLGELPPLDDDGAPDDSSLPVLVDDGTTSLDDEPAGDLFVPLLPLGREPTDGEDEGADELALVESLLDDPVDLDDDLEPPGGDPGGLDDLGDLGDLGDEPLPLHDEPLAPSPAPLPADDEPDDEADDEPEDEPPPVLHAPRGVIL